MLCTATLQQDAFQNHANPRFDDVEMNFMEADQSRKLSIGIVRLFCKLKIPRVALYPLLEI